MELNVPAINGAGDSLSYFVDPWRDAACGVSPRAIGDISIHEPDFIAITGAEANPVGNGLTYIDHLNHNLRCACMKERADFYETLFGFREMRYYNIQGKLTGLKSKAMTSRCGKIRIPINESSEEKSRTVEYLDLYRGEAIQHIALGTAEISSTVGGMKIDQAAFQDTTKTYYDLVDRRLPWQGENVAKLCDLRIILDGASNPTSREMLLICTETMAGPIFFEITQRKGDQGFGEGNVGAPFEFLERDQVRRRVLKNESVTP